MATNLGHGVYEIPSASIKHGLLDISPFFKLHLVWGFHMVMFYCCRWNRLAKTSRWMIKTAGMFWEDVSCRHLFSAPSIKVTSGKSHPAPPVLGAKNDEFQTADGWSPHKLEDNGAGRKHCYAITCNLTLSPSKMLWIMDFNKYFNGILMWIKQ